MAFNSRAHWRGLIGSTAIVLAAAFVAPRWLPQPDLDEHRALAGAPNWPRSISDWRAFPRDVDAYVADRFPARAGLIGALNYLRLKIGVSGSDQVIVGRDGWLFYDSGDALAAARNVPTYTDAEAKAWLEALAGRTEALAARGIAYLVAVPPGKEVMLPQYGPAWYAGPDPNRPAAMLARLADASRAGELLYLYDALERPTHFGLKTYSPHDTHWTGLGAYEGYAAILRRLKAMGVTSEGPRPLEAFAEVRAYDYSKPRDLALMLGVGSYVDVDYPELEDPAQQQLLRTTYLGDNTSWTGPRVVETGNAGKPVLLLLMDSYSNALNPFLYGHFSRIIFAHNQDGAWREDLIDRYKPHVVITEVAERGVTGVMTPSPASSADARHRVDLALAGPHRLKSSERGAARFDVGGRENDRIVGTDGRDALMGKGGDDILDGGADNDNLRGGQGDDKILGGQGIDWLSGDRGDDTLTGGEGPDVFHGFAGAGLDVVTDFSATDGDRVELDAGTTFKVIQVGVDTIIEMSGAKIVLASVNAAELPEGWVYRR